METPEERGTPAQGKSITEKLKEIQEFSKRRYRLAQKGSQEEAFWDGRADGLAVAILIVECEQ